MLTKGARVRVHHGSQRVTGVVELASDNGDSLLVRLGAPLRVAEGLYVNFVALLRSEAGGPYRDLLCDAVIEVHAEH